MSSPEIKHYKIRLSSGRVLGPFDLERISVFISKGKIMGNEVARLYPSGTWRDINQFPEIAELILKHIEGRLEKGPAVDMPEEEAAEVEAPPPEEPAEPVVKASTRQTKVPVPTRDEEGTLVITRDTEGTVVIERPADDDDLPEIVKEDAQPPQEAGEDGIVYQDIDDIAVDDESASPTAKAMMREKTVMLKAPPKAGSERKGIFSKISPRTMKVLMVLGVIVLAMELLAPEKELPKVEAMIPFLVEFPVLDKNKIDAAQSEVTFKSALSFYNLDTVDGYKRAAMIFSKAVTQNPGNISAMSLMASCYINLVDVLHRDEKFFQVVNGLIEAARAKQVDIPELVVVEVELFNLFSNPEAAITRLVEYSKVKLQQSQALPVEMFYYLALSYYYKGEPVEALKYLDQLPQDQWFSVRIPYLYGLIFESNNQLDQAVAAFEKVIQKSPKHLKARSHLAEILLRKDNLAGAGAQADYVILNEALASPAELARAHYIRGKLRGSVKRDDEALADLEAARKLDPDNADILLEYYTVRARVSSVGGDAAKRAKLYQMLAQGEVALKKNDLATAMKSFMAARKEDERMAQPLVRVAEVYRLQGDLYNAMKSYEKAVKIDPTKSDYYPGYIRYAIETYEFKAAQEAIGKYVNATPAPPAWRLDLLNGYLYLRLDRFRDAAAYLKRALKTNAPDVRVYLLFAETMYKTENYKDAAFFYGLARRFDPGSIEAITGLAKALAERDGLDAGVKYVEEQLKKSAHKAYFYVALAEVYFKKGDLSNAMRYADLAINDDKKFPRAHKVKGDILQAQEQYRDAITSYQAYLALNPNDPEGRVEKYRIYMKKMDFVSARLEIDQIILAYPRYPGGHFMLGDLALQAQNPQEAFREAELELTNNPGYLPALVLSGNALNMAKEFPKALDRFNKALTIDSNYVPALIGSGFSNHKLKSYAAAQTMLERAAKIDPGNPMVRKLLGSLYFDMGNRELSAQNFRAYLELYPNAPDKVEIERFIQ